MKEFFNGWRRRIGVITLAMSLAFMGGWVRSSFVKDHLTFDFKHRRAFQAISFDGHVGIVLRNGFSRTTGSGIRLRQSPVESIQEWAAERGDWSWYQIGFGTVHQKFEVGYLKGWFAHYWTIVIPLTLISFWLLLSKSRNSTPIKTREPAPNEGA